MMSLNFYKNLAVFDLYRKCLYRIREAVRVACHDAERISMPWTYHYTVFVKASFSKRPAAMRACVLYCIKLSVQIEQRYFSLSDLYRFALSGLHLTDSCSFMEHLNPYKFCRNCFKVNSLNPT